MQEGCGLEIPETLEEACDPGRAALLVYDMQVGVLQQVPERRLPEVLRLINTVNSTRLSWGAFWVRPTDQQLCFDLCLPAVEPPTCNQVHVAVSAQTVVDRFGRIDGLVNAAGITKRVPTLDMDTADWRSIVDINLNGTLIASQVCGRIMRAQGPATA